MATIEATASEQPTNQLGPRAAWVRWWLAGTRLDWGFVLLSAALIGAGYYQSWVTRTTFPDVPSWASIPPQAAWLAVTVYIGAAGLLAWRRDGDLRAAIPEGYEASVAGCVVFLVGIVINGWWTDTLGPAFGVPAIFRLPNLLEVTGGVLIVLGPLRASTARGELVASPTALLSAVLLLAAITFFTQFDHPYIDRYAAVEIPRPPDPLTAFDQFDHREQILGALGLMMQAAAVTGVILWTLRQTRLPVGSITLMLTATAFVTATQLGHYSMVGVAAIVGALSDVALAIVGPRADRVWRMHGFAVLTGALLAGVYLVWIGIDPGTWWAPDMTYGSVLACAIVGGVVSYVLFPGADATRAASVLWPAAAQDSSSESPDVTVERVEHALKVMHSTRDLADSPLIGLRCLSAPTPAELRRTIESAIEHLQSSAFQQDAQAGQILDLYYVRRIGGHYAVEMRVGLSRAAYFNRRSYGVRRLVDRLRELEESAATA
ncbi:MAG TPA: hypothetical protein VFR33_09055 [Candidatus Dormibacteraeota bacterium]|nr:hypothetical protein [Candidatus Dormibacteraeota bacterium]